MRIRLPSPPLELENTNRQLYDYLIQFLRDLELSFDELDSDVVEDNQGCCPVLITEDSLFYIGTEDGDILGLG